MRSGANFRDGNVAAPLKLDERRDDHPCSPDFRDGNVAAPLKHERAARRAGRSADFRDGNVAAPLKLRDHEDAADFRRHISATETSRPH